MKVDPCLRGTSAVAPVCEREQVITNLRPVIVEGPLAPDAEKLDGFQKIVRGHRVDAETAKRRHVERSVPVAIERTKEAHA